MGIFFSYDENGHILLNELEAVQPGQNDDNDTSTTDYTQEDDDNQDQQQEEQPQDDGGNDPSSAPEDYTISDDGGEDQTPEEADGNPPEEGTEADGGQPDAGGGSDVGGGTEDYTADGGGGGDAGGGSPDGGGDPAAEGGEGTDDAGMDDGDGGGSPSEDEIKALEDEIYSNYSDAQRAIMSKELKTSMNKLMVLSGDLVDRINDIPKVSSHIRVIEFVSNKLSDLRDMISDYLYYTFDTESYIKNQISYKRFVVIMNQIDELISKIPTVDGVKNKNENDQD